MSRYNELLREEIAKIRMKQLLQEVTILGLLASNLYLLTQL